MHSGRGGTGYVLQAYVKQPEYHFDSSTAFRLITFYFILHFQGHVPEILNQLLKPRMTLDEENIPTQIQSHLRLYEIYNCNCEESKYAFMIHQILILSYNSSVGRHTDQVTRKNDRADSVSLRHCVCTGSGAYQSPVHSVPRTAAEE